ncbi:MAG: xylulokinase [Trueperaceae bacterium]|nr:xylulokinase [Trueperaceae bacterium]
MRYVLALDLGTGSLKAALYDETMSLLAQASAPYPVEAPRPGWAETDPQTWWDAAARATRQLFRDTPADTARHVAAVGFSGQMHGVVLCDGAGQPLRPALLWADRRADAQLGAYRGLEPSQKARLANPLVAGMAGPLLLWLREHEAEHYHQARHALQPKDWLRLQLTGLAYSEPSDASGTLLYDLYRDAWDEDVIAALQLRRELLPDLIDTAAVAGELSTAAAEHLGLPSGIPVVAGAADTAAAALGSGVTEPPTAQLTTGTGAQLIRALAEPQAAPERGLHLYRAALPERYYTMAAMQNAGLALEWVRGCFGLDWEEFYRLAEDVSAGADGVTFLPHLSGERTPHLNPAARGAWFGLSLGSSPSHMVRAALEGVAFAVREGAEAIEGLESLSNLRLAGGGSTYPLWQQLLSDVLHKPLHVTSVANASARGAALLALRGLGVKDEVKQPEVTERLEPTPSPALDDAFERFRDLYRRLYR